MSRVHVASKTTRQLLALCALVACLWLSGVLLAWTVAVAAPDHPAAGAPTHAVPSPVQVAPKRWMLVPLEMA